MIGHGGGIFQRAAIFEIGGDPGRAKAVVADVGFDAGTLGAAADHGVGVGLAERGVAQPFGGAADGAEQGCFGLAQAADLYIGEEIFLQLVMAGHFVPFATLFMKA